MTPSRALRPWLFLLCAAIPVRAAVVRVPAASFVPVPVLAVAAVGAFPALPLPVVSAVSAVPAIRVIAPVSAASAREEPPSDWTSYFDGALPAAEGEIVRAPILSAGGSPSPGSAFQLAAVRAATREAAPALARSVNLGNWNGPNTTLEGSACGDAAPKLAVLLRARGVPARLVEAEFHYYLIVPTLDGPIIVDPTIRQFFGRERSPRSVPLIFAGTVAELTALYRAHLKAKTSRFDPSRIYFSQAETRESKLRELEARLASDDRSPELEVLREFRRGPRSALPPPPSGLILPNSL